MTPTLKPPLLAPNLFCSEQPSYERSVEPVGLLKLLSLFRLPSEEFLLLSIDNILPGPEICCLRANPLGLVPEFVPEDHDQIKWNTEITSDEVFIVKVAVCVGTMHKDPIVLREGDQDGKCERTVRASHSKRCFKRKRIFRNILGFPGLDESYVTDQN
jgi:hypothetical protein